MKFRIGLKFSPYLIVIFSLQVFAQEAKPTIDSLNWLSGCWEQNDAAKKRFGSEQWMKPAGQSMLGMSRTVKNGKVSGFEFLRIVEDDSGIHYISRPSQNKEETSFKLIKSGANKVVFENPAHDFPQRIIYRLEKTNLFARIEGKNNGKLTAIDFPMIKAKCG